MLSINVTSLNSNWSLLAGMEWDIAFLQEPRVDGTEQVLRDIRATWGEVAPWPCR